MTTGRQVRDLEGLRDHGEHLVVAFLLEHLYRTETINESTSLLWINVAQDNSIDHDRKEVVRRDQVEISLHGAHAQFGEKLLELMKVVLQRTGFTGNWGTRKSDVIEQTTRRAIRCMYGANEPPRLRKQLTHRSRLHLCEVLSSMDTPEMREVARIVQLISDHGEPGSLLQIQLRLASEVSGSQEVLHLLADACL